MAITKGVIAAAGRGSRFAPATNVIPKEMFPIGNKPIIQHLVEEYIASGVTDIAIVITPEKKAIMDHLNSVDEITSKVRLSYYFQRKQYGNGVPILDTAGFIEGDSFAFAFADDFVLSEAPFTKKLLERHSRTGCPVIGVDTVPIEHVSRYGVVDLHENLALADNAHVIRRVVEKPSREEAPSNLVQFGRMVLVPRIVAMLADTPPGKGGEVWLADAIERFINEGGIVVAEKITDGRWLDTGNPLAYAMAFTEYMLASGEHGPAYAAYLHGRNICAQS